MGGTAREASGGGVLYGCKTPPSVGCADCHLPICPLDKLRGKMERDWLIIPPDASP